MASHRIVIIGAGHNGLVTANLLAEAGHTVTVLEARHIVGGACVTEELWPGFKVSSTSYVNTLFLPQAVERFQLARHGYKVIRQDPAFFVPYPDGSTLTLHGDDRDTAEIAKFSTHDAETWPLFQAMLQRIGNVIRPLILKTPPVGRQWHDLWDLLQTGRSVRRLSPADLQSFVSLATMGVKPVLDAWFESEHLKAFLCAQAVVGALGGVHQPGTAFLLLHDTLGGVEGATGVWGVVVGGMGAITLALAAAARERKVEIRTNVPVARIELGGSAKPEGVRLQSGEVVRADVIVSNATPRRTFLELLPESALPKEFLRRIRGFKDLGASLKVHFALTELPDFTAAPGKGTGPQHRGLINFCPTVDFIERAWDDCKRGEFSQHPTIEACIHSVLDPSCAPPGRHVMTCFVQFGPRHLATGNWESMKATVAERVLAEMAPYAPNLPSAVIERHVYTPEDLETQFGLTGGNIYHGAMTPDQMFAFRPAAGFADYCTPVKNLYLCGSGAHPGGGVWGAPGWNAAHKILRDIGRG
ncbi:MAG TPA: NAD(P)/FAD-dependent oxidoreductase [Acidobacteriota bacterium]|nr:NAD(P)/FAD-dependent oxidoreductase [Acidobacteriota bacterium]